MGQNSNIRVYKNLKRNKHNSLRNVLMVLEIWGWISDRSIGKEANKLGKNEGDKSDTKKET